MMMEALKKEIYIKEPAREVFFDPRSEVLVCDKITKIYPTPKGDYTVLADLELTVKKGEFISIIGHSGCGKSTLLTMIAGLNEISGGNVLVEGTKVKGAGPDRAVVFQSPSLFPWLTAFQNVMIGVKQVFPHGTKQQRNDLCH